MLGTRLVLRALKEKTKALKLKKHVEDFAKRLILWPYPEKDSINSCCLVNNCLYSDYIYFTGWIPVILAHTSHLFIMCSTILPAQILIFGGDSCWIQLSLLSKSTFIIPTTMCSIYINYCQFILHNVNSFYEWYYVLIKSVCNHLNSRLGHGASPFRQATPFGCPTAKRWRAARWVQSLNRGNCFKNWVELF